MFDVVFCILLLVIYMLAVADQFPRLGKRELICLLSFTRNSERFPVPLGAWDGLRYFIVALWALPYNYLFRKLSGHT